MNIETAYVLGCLLGIVSGVFWVLSIRAVEIILEKLKESRA